MHDKMHHAVNLAGGRIDAVFFCPHAQDAGCACRKPKPGLLLEIASRFNVALAEVPMIGDSLRDLQAASAAGARPILVLTGKGKQTRTTAACPRAPRSLPTWRAVAALSR